MQAKGEEVSCFLVLWGTVDQSPMYFSASQEYQNEFFMKNYGPVTVGKLQEMKQDEQLGEYGLYLEKQYVDGVSNLFIVNSRGYQVLFESSKIKDNLMLGANGSRQKYVNQFIDRQC